VSEQRPSNIILKTAHREIRVTSKLPLAHPPISPTITDPTFAEGISQRYQSRTDLGTNLNLLLRQQRWGVRLQPQYQQSLINFSPNLSFTLLNVKRLIHRQDLPSVITRESRTVVATDRLVHRLVTQFERINAIASDSTFAKPAMTRERVASQPGRMPLPKGYPAATPVTKTFRRYSPASNPAEMPVPISQAQHSLWAVPSTGGDRPPSLISGQTRMSSPYPPAAHQEKIDLNQLTDQVVQAIDRRMIAYRERLGRI
jgi:hypothetical protein